MASNYNYKWSEKQIERMAWYNRIKPIVKSKRFNLHIYFTDKEVEAINKLSMMFFKVNPFTKPKDSEIIAFALDFPTQKEMLEFMRFYKYKKVAF